MGAKKKDTRVPTLVLMVVILSGYILSLSLWVAVLALYLLSIPYHKFLSSYAILGVYPILIGVSAVLSVFFFLKNRYRAAALALFLPLADVVLIVVDFAVNVVRFRG